MRCRKNSASVWADITRPDRSTALATFTGVEPGLYSAVVATTSAGLHHVRVRAEGATSGGYPCMREKSFCTGVFAGGDRPTTSGPSSGGAHDALCELLTRLLADKVLDRRAVAQLKKAGIDVAALKKCMARFCGPGQRQEMPMKAKRAVKAPAAKTTKTPKALSGVEATAAPGTVEPTIRDATKTKPLPRPPQVDVKAQQARAELATAHFHRDPFPTLVDGGHGPHQPHGGEGGVGDTQDTHAHPQHTAHRSSTGRRKR
jgi:hypothetical protein